ncbi:hypothetical protein BON79_00540 [Escherichia coli]|nr:hypothetical protein BON78_17500 [Escherichia coli]TEZ88802.1 hypothetical protein BON79_00540 [Escherichia coli]
MLHLDTIAGCGVNALSGLHIHPRRSDKTRQRRIRHLGHCSSPTSTTFSTIQMPLSSDPH